MGGFLLLIFIYLFCFIFRCLCWIRFMMSECYRRRNICWRFDCIVIFLDSIVLISINMISPIHAFILHRSLKVLNIITNSIAFLLWHSHKYYSTAWVLDPVFASDLFRLGGLFWSYSSLIFEGLQLKLAYHRWKLHPLECSCTELFYLLAHSWFFGALVDPVHSGYWVSLKPSFF